MYRFLLKPILFLFDPEKIHHSVFRMVRTMMKIPGLAVICRSMYVVKDERLERKLFGITFPNPVGLAAGFDKDAKLFDELSYFGFGFVEIGTITPVGQPGNPKPRLFRLPADQALINRMGFNNGGVEEAVERLRNRKTKVVIGGNIGKNKVTPNEEATNDYLISFRALHPVVDYFVVNVSSPNTPNLRALQDKEPLTRLLSALKEKNRAFDVQRPILLKIAPDLTNEQLDDIISIVAETGIEGVIATNTTISRADLQSSQSIVDGIGAGGLSGKPLTDRATEVIKYLSEKSNKAFPIIGVGGIHKPEDALRKLEAGADLVQVYTGFIYEGPTMVKRINKAILKS